jgi:hypothetical protein
VVHEPEVEAEDDLGEVVARRLVERLDASKRAPVSRSVTSTRRLDSSVWTSGTCANGCPRWARATARWFCALELVVELLGDPLAQLGVDRLDVEAGREPLDQRQQQRQVAQVGVDGLGDARILDLDRDRLARERDRPVAPGRSRPRRRPPPRTPRTPSRACRPSSSRSSFSTCLNGSGGTSSRSLPSVCLKFSRSSGAAP